MSTRRGDVRDLVQDALLLTIEKLCRDEVRELGRIVRAIARRVSFFPPRSDPHFERWMALLRSAL